MTHSQIILDPDTLPADGRPWTFATISLLAALLVFMPAAMGAVEAWSELIVLLGAAALSICLTLRFALDRSFRPARTWLYLPLALFVLLIAFQLLSLPTGLVEWLSPASIATRQELLDDAGEFERLSALSFYRLATAHDLRLLLVGVTVFAVAANALRNSREIKALLTVILVIGCAEAALALAQIASGTHMIYWSIPTLRNSATSGSFVNYSHFCQFMNLSLGAGIGLLLVRMDEDRRAEFRGPTNWRLLAQINFEKHGWVISGIILCALTVFTSMSRNGAISLMIASAVLAAALYRRGMLSWRGWLIGVVPLGVLAVLLIFGFDMLYERLATLQHSVSYEGRWELTLATLRAWWTFPIWGIGLGTHEFVFPMFDPSVMPSVAAHADNDYAQLLEETGVLGAALVAAFLAGIVALTWKLMFRGRTPLSNAAFGIAFGLTAVAIHSATDFGQRLPAIFCLSAIFCGLLIAMSRIERRSRRKHAAVVTVTSPGTRWRRTAAAAGLLGLAGIWSWALADGYAAHLGERWWAATAALEDRLQPTAESNDDQAYVDLLAAAEAAVRSEPENIKYLYRLNLYRWQSLSRAVDPQTGNIVLHADVLPFVERIADELTQIRRLSPTYGPPLGLEGELRLFVLGDPGGKKLIRRAVDLAPHDPPTCLVAGQLAAQDGELEDAVRLLNRAVGLRQSYFRQAIEIYVSELRRPDLARSLAGDNYLRLNELAKVCAADPEYADLAEGLVAESEASLRRHAATEQALAHELAALARLDFQRSEFESAVALYRRALNLDYKQVEWRLNLAEALVGMDRRSEALHEVRICLRLRPLHPAAMQLLDALSGEADVR